MEGRNKLPDAVIDQSIEDVPPEWFELKSAWDRYESVQGDGAGMITPACLHRRASWLRERRESTRVTLEAEIAYSQDFLFRWEGSLSAEARALSEQRRAAEKEEVF
jgi:hypothetical protein